MVHRSQNYTTKLWNKEKRCPNISPTSTKDLFAWRLDRLFTLRTQWTDAITWRLWTPGRTPWCQGKSSELYHFYTMNSRHQIILFFCMTACHCTPRPMHVIRIDTLIVIILINTYVVFKVVVENPNISDVGEKFPCAVRRLILCSSNTPLSICGIRYVMSDYLVDDIFIRVFSLRYSTTRHMWGRDRRVWDECRQRTRAEWRNYV